MLVSRPDITSDSAVLLKLLPLQVLSYVRLVRMVRRVPLRLLLVRHRPSPLVAVRRPSRPSLARSRLSLGLPLTCLTRSWTCALRLCSLPMLTPSYGTLVMTCVSLRLLRSRSTAPDTRLS